MTFEEFLAEEAKMPFPRWMFVEPFNRVEMSAWAPHRNNEWVGVRVTLNHRGKEYVSEPWFRISDIDLNDIYGPTLEGRLDRSYMKVMRELAQKSGLRLLHR